MRVVLMLLAGLAGAPREEFPLLSLQPLEGNGCAVLTSGGDVYVVRPGAPPARSFENVRHWEINPFDRSEVLVLLRSKGEDCARAAWGPIAGGPEIQEIALPASSCLFPFWRSRASWGFAVMVPDCDSDCLPLPSALAVKQEHTVGGKHVFGWWPQPGPFVYMLLQPPLFFDNGRGCVLCGLGITPMPPQIDADPDYGASGILVFRDGRLVRSLLRANHLEPWRVYRLDADRFAFVEYPRAPAKIWGRDFVHPDGPARLSVYDALRDQLTPVAGWEQHQRTASTIFDIAPSRAGAVRILAKRESDTAPLLIEGDRVTVLSERPLMRPANWPWRLRPAALSAEYAMWIDRDEVIFVELASLRESTVRIPARAPTTQAKR